MAANALPLHRLTRAGARNSPSSRSIANVSIHSAGFCTTTHIADVARSTDPRAIRADGALTLSC
ncbi:MAG: hypothetical protein ACXWPI_14560, partial [Ktedonobacterales bacterium]